MRRKRQSLPWLGILVLGVLVLSPAVLGQTSPGSEAGVPVPTDWSHQHVIFSRPANEEQARRVQQDPRYWQQLVRRSQATLPEAETGDDPTSELRPDTNSLSGKSHQIARDWSQDLGTAATVGAGNYPAKFTFRGTNANCGNALQPDFVVYSTGLTGAVGQASIAAYDNLYSGCTAPVPAVYWAYNTGGQVLTSPVLSGDGTQIAFVQTSAGAGSLVLLKWAASTTETISGPLGLSALAFSSYSGCPAPCMATSPLKNGGGTADNDTHSSVFYDYNNDAAYVGDDSGWLHKFTPVFNGVPAEVTAGWPVQVNPGAPTALTSPVHDISSGNVFVGDKGGFLYLVNSSTGAVTKSGRLDFGVGFTQGPIIDGTAGLVYAFASSDGTTTNCPGGAACSAVYQLTNGFAAGNTGTKAQVGTSTVSPAPPNPQYLGAFDSSYYNSVNATGNLYVCGDTGLSPTLYRVPLAAGVFGTVVAVAALTPAANHVPCSPVTDISNPNATGGAAERVFFSVQNNSRPTLCAGKGCAQSFVDTPWQASTAYKVGQEVLVLRTTNNTLWVNVVTVAGTSGAAPPTWPAQVDTLTVNGTVTFLNQGAPTVVALAGWAATHAYALRARILDSNGNVEIARVAGTSAGAVPTWKTTAGATTTDGGVTWVNAGALPSAALPATGGTSGIIIDNTVGSGTEPGASQVYFSTLSNQVCGTSGTGGCAVQASQSALQ